ncbi:zinc finger BED domain-containing protein RICESLEEPER 2-like isoform X2 [Oryza glaberrima]|uniref:zinc finger BED domain-containing protein RICESLEEPER 2-like isoform X2 n=1 Tax=Oryza glaberrima TaxID=4538 RepID=UPI00224C13CC|nr:zinc finger BED domain-containing protein RICESLEEPER 2-like isoform X2 [Oryza glaberrima]
MIVLHEYPLSMVDHVGFRRFVAALQPLFKFGTRNTIRAEIMDQYEFERKKAIQYMAGIQSRVAITTDLWTSSNQKRGYMAITAHFVDESWKLRSIIMRFIYVPTLDRYMTNMSLRGRRPVGTELDHYLDDDLVDIHTKNFDVLDWWKVAGIRFPVLRRIARDIYAIPVSTVASESAFSTSGRVLSEHRSRLTSKLLEALMCSQDWLRNKYKVDDKNKEQPSFWSCLQDIQEGLQELAI